MTYGNTEKAVSRNLGDVVANEHLSKCVKVCLTDILVTKSQSNMETWDCKYGFLNFSSIHEKIRCKKGI